MDYLPRIVTEGGSIKVRNCVLPAGRACVGGNAYIEYDDASNRTTEQWLAEKVPNDG